MLQEFVQEVVDLIRTNIAGVHTAIPGTIISFNTSTGLATVQPAMKYKKPDGTTMDFPHITGVPVLFQQGAGQSATVAFPVKAGDGCLLIIAEQSIDYWLYGYETSSDLPHDLTNAICIPGLFQKANAAVKQACEQNAIVVSAKNIVFNGDVTVNGDFTTKGGTVRLN